MLRLALNARPVRASQPALSSRCGASAALRPARPRALRPAAGRGGVRVNALGKSPEELAKLQAEYEEAMKDPVKAAALQAQAEAYKKARRAATRLRIPVLTRRAALTLAGDGDAGGQGAGGADGVLHVGAPSHAPSAAVWAARCAAVLTLCCCALPRRTRRCRSAWLRCRTTLR